MRSNQKRYREPLGPRVLCGRQILERAFGLDQRHGCSTRLYRHLWVFPSTRSDVYAGPLLKRVRHQADVVHAANSIPCRSCLRSHAPQNVDDQHCCLPVRPNARGRSYESQHKQCTTSKRHELPEHVRDCTVWRGHSFDRRRLLYTPMGLTIKAALCGPRNTDRICNRG